jgi:hypothetical protein
MLQFLPIFGVENDEPTTWGVEQAELKTFWTNYEGIGLREILQESPIFNGKINGFPEILP